MLQSEAGYIDARPHVRQIDETLLQRTAGPYIWVMYGRRPRCKGKESDFFAKRSGAVMYPAFERGRLTAGPDVIR
jgi:hypothetical protein